MKEKENPNHHMGKRTGYELINGEYHIARLYSRQFQELNHRVGGIETMLNIVTSHAAKDLEELSKSRRRIFEDLADDIGIDLEEGWTYVNYILKRITPKPE